MLDNKSVIIGYSGHAYVVADSYTSQGRSLTYYTNLIEVNNNPYNIEYLGCEMDTNFKGWDMGLNFILGIGDNNARYKTAQLIKSKSKNIISVIDPNSSISNSAIVGDGVFVSRGVLVNAFAKIGDFTILNTGSIIEHECKIGFASHIAPGAVLAGNVTIGNGSFIGANAVVKQGVTIGDNVIIGAGSVVLKDIPNNGTYVGNPIKKIK